MQEYHCLIDEDVSLANEFIQLDIRNQNAHKELQSYNDNGVFLFIHPLTTKLKHQLTFVDELIKLKKEEPAKFIDECYSITKNIKRYQAELNKDNFSCLEDKQRCIDNLNRYLLKNDIASSILNG